MKESKQELTKVVSHVRKMAVYQTYTASSSYTSRKNNNKPTPNDYKLLKRMTSRLDESSWSSAQLLDNSN